MSITPVVPPYSTLVPQINDRLASIGDEFTGSLQSHSIANTGGSLTPAATVFQGRASKFTGNISSDRAVVWNRTDTPAGPNVLWNIAKPPDTAGYTAPVRTVSVKTDGGSEEVILRPGFSVIAGHDGTELRAFTPQYNPDTDDLIAHHVAFGNGHINPTAGYLPVYPDQRTAGAVGGAVITIRELLTDLTHYSTTYDPLSGNGPYGTIKFEGLGTWVQIKTSTVLPAISEVYGNRSLLEEISDSGSTQTHLGKIIGCTGEILHVASTRWTTAEAAVNLYNHTSNGTTALGIGTLSQIDTSSGSAGLIDVSIGALAQYTLSGGTDITSARGFNSALSITGTTTDVGIFYHFRADTPSIASGATCATLVGFDCFDQSGVTGVTTHYNFRSRGANSRNQFEGLTGLGSSTAPVSKLSILVAPTASANYGTISLGGGAWDGSTSGFFTGSSSGTQFAINAASGSVADLANWQIAGVQKFKVSSGGHLNAWKPVVAKTADYTVLASEVNTFFTNTGASGAIVFTLPTPVVGMKYEFVRDANQTVTIDIGGSVTIRVGASVSTSGGNVTLDAVGSRIRLIAISTTQWVGDLTGTATFN